MAIKSPAAIYGIIETHLRESADPLTCTKLYDFADVKANAVSVDKVSDFLGLMWRRGLIQRWNVPASSTDRSRYAYSWITEKDATAQKITKLESVKAEYRSDNITVTEDNGRIIIDFPKFTVTVQSKV